MLIMAVVEAYIESWLKWRPRGKVLIPDRPYNQGYWHPNVIRVSKGNISEALAELNKLYDRGESP